MATLKGVAPLRRVPTVFILFTPCGRRFPHWRYLGFLLMPPICSWPHLLFLHPSDDRIYHAALALMECTEAAGTRRQSKGERVCF